MHPFRNSLNHRLHLALAILLIIAAGEFVIRGPVRFERAESFNDFISPYIQTRAWLQGVDPYSPASLVTLWPRDAVKFDFLTHDLASHSLVLKRGIPTAYPPTSFVLLAPIALLPWHTAHRLWLIVTCLSVGVTILVLAAFAGLQLKNKIAYIFLALALALAPFHTGMAAGSIVILVIGLFACAILAEERGRAIAAGVLIALAVSLKPQIGLPLLAYYTFRRRWRLTVAAAISLVLIAAVAIAVLEITHTPWRANYKYDNQILFSHGSLGDFTEANPIRFGLVNLQVLLYTFFGDRAVANGAALLIASLLAGLWLVQVLRSPSASRDKLLEISALVAISLLPVYHRLYDATLLVVPLAWSLSAITRSRNRFAKATLFLILIFLLPGGSLLEGFQRRNYWPQLQHSWFWMCFVMPHQVWALVLLSLVLLIEMRRNAVQKEDVQVPPEQISALAMAG